MRQKQLSLSFTPQERPPDPAAIRRREVAEAIARRKSGRKIDHLMKTGAAPNLTEAQEQIVVQCIRREFRGLKQIVECISQGGIARDRRQQAAAEMLDRVILKLPELQLAHRLIALGLCDSTDSYPRDIGVHRFVLWNFRKAMIQAGLWEE